jgi:hypothetical protein
MAPVRDMARRASERSPSRLARLLVTALLAGAAIAGGPGCQRVLFADRTPRTQFESFDRMRQRYVPTEEPDVFGNPRPAIKARLAPRT